jgi:hypothetical protein
MECSDIPHTCGTEGPLFLFYNYITNVVNGFFLNSQLGCMSIFIRHIGCFLSKKAQNSIKTALRFLPNQIFLPKK